MVADAKVLCNTTLCNFRQVVNVLFFLSLYLIAAHLGPRIDSITVSPDIRYRNSSIVSLRRKVDVNHISLTALTNDHGNPAGIGSDANGIVIETDRQRRLIPYMTFYMPTHEYHNPPISQAYAYNMPLVRHKRDFRVFCNRSYGAPNERWPIDWAGK
jgi:hypothetical protein